MELKQEQIIISIIGNSSQISKQGILGLIENIENLDIHLQNLQDGKIIELDNDFFRVTDHTKFSQNLNDKSLSLSDLLVLGFLRLTGRTKFSDIQELLPLSGRQIISSIAKIGLMKSLKLLLTGQSQLTSEYVFLEITKDTFENSQLHQFFDEDFIDKLGLLNALLTIVDTTRLEYLESEYLSEYLLDTLLQNQTFKGSQEISNSNIVVLLSLATFFDEVKLQLAESEYIQLLKYSLKTPQKSKIIKLNPYLWVNYSSLLGFLGTRDLVTIKQLQEVVYTTSQRKISSTETLLILSNLVYSGQLQIKLIDKQTLLISQVTSIHKESSNIAGIKAIILGCLISGNKKIREIADLTSTSVDFIHSQLYQLKDLINLKFEISRDKQIHVKSIPTIPPMNQPQFLLQNLKLIYAMVQSDKSYEIQLLSSHSDLTANEVKMSLYELAGIGLLKINLSKEKVTVSNLSKKSRYFNSDKSYDESKLLELIKDQTVISRDTLTELQFPYEQFLNSMSNLILQNKIKISSLDDKKWIFDLTQEFQKTKIECANCRELISNNQITCSNCGTIANTCLICKNIIFKDDSIKNCPHCEKSGHTSHFETWLNLKAECPACRRELSTVELLNG